MVKTDLLALMCMVMLVKIFIYFAKIMFKLAINKIGGNKDGYKNRKKHVT